MNDATDRVWQLIRRKGIGSYAEGQEGRDIVLEEHEAPEMRRRIDRMTQLDWSSWATRELVSILEEEACTKR